MGLGLPELLVILLVVLLVFGANKIPQLGDALGKGIRNFKKASQDDAIDVTPKSEPSQQGQLPASPSAAAQSAAAAKGAEAARKS